MVGAEWEAPGHINVRQEIRTKLQVEGRKGGSHKHSGGFSGLQAVSFNYMGIILTTSNYYWPVVVNNIIKDRRKRSGLSMILGRGGGNARTSGIFYKASVKATLLFVS